MLTEILSGLLGLIGPLTDSTKGRRESKDEALRAISTALNETIFYYKRLENGKKRSLETEQKLSSYWSVAAIFIRHFDEYLAEICEHKSEFWGDYENWTDDKIESTGIQLKNVQKEYRKLLLPQKGIFQRKWR